MPGSGRRRVRRPLRRSLDRAPIAPQRGRSARVDRGRRRWRQLDAWATAAALDGIIRADLFADPSIRIFAGRRSHDAPIDAGAIANLTGEVVGLSNVSASDQHAHAVWRDLQGVVATGFPGHAIVGYERGDDLGFRDRERLHAARSAPRLAPAACVGPPALRRSQSIHRLREPNAAVAQSGTRCPATSAAPSRRLTAVDVVPAAGVVASCSECSAAVAIVEVRGACEPAHAADPCGFDDGKRTRC